MRTIHWERGTLVLEGFPEVPPGFELDPRNGLPRAPGSAYHGLILALHREKLPFEDKARAYGVLGRPHALDRTPREYQREALEAWRGAGRRGVVVLPTGAGKSLVAELCIADADRDALIVAPTLDLVGQWRDGLGRAFGEPIGVVGGGWFEVEKITVTTYDSAHLHIDRLGHRFGTVVFDEVHHLPGPAYATAALAALAPFRLGLSATPERTDGGHQRLDTLVGPLVYRKEITELEGEFLAPYRTECVKIPLTPDQRAAYDEARLQYRSFVEKNGIRVGAEGGWQRFLMIASRSAEGKAAMAAWRRSRRILQGSESKLAFLEAILRRHWGQRVLIFTNDNDTAYEVSRTFLVPVITHRTEAAERKGTLRAFAEGSLPILATSRVLNEGVDVPAAEVAVVLSGTGTVREHVQRLGRILRPKEGKQAVLYEVLAEDTVEERTSERRRDHVGFQR